jgi:hypothetical protein
LQGRQHTCYAASDHVDPQELGATGGTVWLALLAENVATASCALGKHVRASPTLLVLFHICTGKTAVVAALLHMLQRYVAAAVVGTLLAR